CAAWDGSLSGYIF
nr:immunoglobulin light chain junction region [Macaca mulatta]